MTDTFGSEPHDQNVETPLETGDSQQSQDAATEAPSDLEFSDETPPEETSSEEPPEEKPATRTAFLPVVAALGGILLLGGVAWFQLGGSSSFSLLPPIDKAASNLSMPSLPPSRPAENKPIASAPAALALPSAPSPKTDSVVQKTSESTESPLGASSSALPSLPEIPSPQVKPVENIVSVVVPATPVVSSATEPVPAPFVPTPVQTTSDSDRRIEALTSRIDSLQKALDQANQQLGQMTTSLAASSAQEAASSSSAKALQERIDKLEQQLEAVSKRPATPEPTASVAPQKSPAEETLATPIEKPAAFAKHKESRKSAPKPVKSAASAGKPVNAMVLRAVSSGHAWIAKNAASSELTEVIVGDKIAGIGTIKAIEQSGGKWIVRGTKGTIQ